MHIWVQLEISIFILLPTLYRNLNCPNANSAAAQVWNQRLRIPFYRFARLFKLFIFDCRVYELFFFFHQMVGKYKIEEMLGDGTFGEVFKGSYEENGTTYHVAVKMLKRSDKHLQDEAKREFELLKPLQHRNIVRCLEGVGARGQVLRNYPIRKPWRFKHVHQAPTKSPERSKIRAMGERKSNRMVQASRVRNRVLAWQQGHAPRP